MTELWVLLGLGWLVVCFVFLVVFRRGDGVIMGMGLKVFLET